MRCGPKLGERAGIGVHVADRIDLWNFRDHSLSPVPAPTPQANLQDAELIHWREQSKQIDCHGVLVLAVLADVKGWGCHRNASHVVPLLAA
jgi:hypothetical protein